MNEKIIERVPEFSHELDEHTLSKLDPGERYLAIELSKLRKEIRWASETARQGFNLGLENNKIISKWRRMYESPATLVFWILGIAVVAAITSIVTKWLESKS